MTKPQKQQKKVHAIIGLYAERKILNVAMAEKPH